MFRTLRRFCLCLLLLAAAATIAPLTAGALSANPVPNIQDDDLYDANVLVGIDASGTQSISEWASSSSDEHDVYAVWVNAGESLEVTLSTGAGTGWHLRLYDPHKDSMYGPVGVPGAVPPPPSPLTDVAGEGILTASISPTESGRYFVDVFAGYDGGEGVYQLDLAIKHPSSDVVLTSAAKTLTYRSTPIIAGTVRDRFGASIPSTGSVVLSYSFDGYNWIPLTSQPYGGAGFSASGLSQWRKTYYLVTFLGADGYGMSSQGTAAYQTYINFMMSAVDTDVYTWRKGAYYYAYGDIQPVHPVGSSPVRIYRYKRVNGVWKSYGYVSAKVKRSNNWLSRYEVRMSLPSAGSWRLRAYAPADSQHAATWSKAYRYITVK